MKINSTFGPDVIVVFSVVAAVAVALSIDTTLNAYAQNTTTATNQTADSQQIKNYLTQAIQALDSGNNTNAMEQVNLAGDQLESLTGTEDGEDEEEDDEEEGEVEEGAGEDADEPGDVDANDQEDTP
jgi:cell division protein FtsX